MPDPVTEYRPIFLQFVVYAPKMHNNIHVRMVTYYLYQMTGSKWQAH